MTQPKGVPVTLSDGKERYLHYTLRDAKTVNAESDKKDGLDSFVHILFIGLRRDDPSLTEDKLYDLVEMSEIAAINTKIQEALGTKPQGVSDNVTVPLANSAQTSQI